MNRILDLVVVCGNFGLSYSGGSTATARLVQEMLDDFHTITILCQNDDGYLKEQVRFIGYSELTDIPNLLEPFPKEKTVLYGDFYISQVATRIGFPFFFTYHDNWPEFAAFTKDTPQIAATLEAYQDIFQASNMVFSVSDYKVPFISEATDKVMVVRNGLSQKITKTKIANYTDGIFRILILGNVGFRKYAKAIELFKQLDQLKLPIQIDVFGNIEEEGIFEQVNQFEFVQYQGFKKEISYEGYHLLLQTSVIENLSLSIVDALANATPVLSFDVGGIREVIDDSNGRIVAPFDIPKMAAIIEDFIRDFPKFDFNPNKLTAFNWAKSAKKMVEVIYDVAHRKSF